MSPVAGTTVPALGVGIRPRGPSTLPSRLTLPIMSWVARATSKSSQPSFWIFSIRSSPPAKSAPASFALATLSPWQKTTTRTALPMPCGSDTLPRTIWSLCVVSMPSAHVDFDGLVELGPLHLLEQSDGPLDGDVALPCRASASGSSDGCAASCRARGQSPGRLPFFFDDSPGAGDGAAAGAAFGAGGRLAAWPLSAPWVSSPWGPAAASAAGAAAAGSVDSGAFLAMFASGSLMASRRALAPGGSLSDCLFLQSLTLPARQGYLL